MDSPPSMDQETLINAHDTSSIISLLERGIQCARQGNYTEGVAFFALVRDQLTTFCVPLADALEASIKSNVSYWQAQEMLHLASKRFADADAEQKSTLLAIEKLLPLLSKESAQKTQQPTQSQPHHLSEEQVQPLQKPSNVQATSIDSQPSQLAPNEPELTLKEKNSLPDLYITCFGRFEVRRFGKAVLLCQNRNGQTVLRYLIAQPKYSASRDVLMTILWPEEAPEVALRKLQIAVSALRCSLNSGYVSDTGGGYILYREPFYLLNPAVAIRTDVDEFLSLWQAGRSTGDNNETIKLFEQAMRLYIHSFLVEDMYADWSSAKRENLSQASLSMCRTLTTHYLETGHFEDAEKWACENIKRDRCDEHAYRQLMLIYAMKGQRSEALRQYQHCKHILAEELGITPSAETVNLLQTLLTNENSSTKEIERK